jgi:hypothetical protein
MPIVKMSLLKAKSRPFTAAERTRLAALAVKPDAEIDFFAQPGITDADIAAGRRRVVRRGGVRAGAGRKPGGRQQVSLQLLPATLRRWRAQAKREGKTISDVAEARLLAKT